MRDCAKHNQNCDDKKIVYFDLDNFPKVLLLDKSQGFQFMITNKQTNMSIVNSHLKTIVSRPIGFVVQFGSTHLNLQL